ncbi:Uncharacterised protein [Bordetella pertussis]|nr:Uncharacterised protein [Bordetella pertussis]
MAEAAIWLPSPSRMISLALCSTSSGKSSNFRSCTSLAKRRVRPWSLAAVSSFMLISLTSVWLTANWEYLMILL